MGAPCEVSVVNDKALESQRDGLAKIANRIRLEAGGVRMPTRNVSLTKEMDEFVAMRVQSGRYENASEVVRAGLRTLKLAELEYEAKVEGLRAAIAEGLASGVAKGDVFGRVRRKSGVRVRDRR